MDLFKLLDRPIAFQRSFVRLGAGISGALFLSQAVYWNARTSDPDGWFFKTQNEWEEETGLKRTEQEKARKTLTSLGILEELKKGIPAKLYYRVNEHKLALALQGEIQKVSLDEVILIFSSTLKSMSKTGYMRALNIGVEAEYIDYVEVLKLYGMTCSCCGNPIVFGPGKKSPCLSFDHVIPLAKNGRHVFENLRPAHFGCNSSKGDKLEANKDAYAKQTGMSTQGNQQCLDKANIHTEITTEITDPPNPQEGEGVELILTDAKKALEFYNEQTGTRCRDLKPFVMMLTPTTTRAGYTLDELQLVIRWVLATWRRRGDSLPKPANICRVNRFDGYLADAEAWAVTETDIDPEAVMNGYNEIFADVLPAAELDTDRRRMITRLAAHMKNKTTGAFLGYFEKFRADASDFYFGENGGWRASFDYLMKPETLRKTREGAL
ncbi:HNH endonuclease signature motif containing protein [Klebsiella pasteurii]|nr:HNH endonuclease signature motif containing protein [Klebsiella pasteurii]